MKKIILIIFTISISLMSKSQYTIEKKPRTIVQMNLEVPHNKETFQPSQNYETFITQWALHNYEKNKIIKTDIDIPYTLNFVTQNAPVIVGILDTGIDINHVNLLDSIFLNKSEIPGNGIDDDGNGYIDDIHGWDFVNNDNTVFDSSGLDKHGTLSAGIIKVVSMNANVKILPLKVLENSTNIDDESLVKAINYAQMMGAKIINCSLEGFKYNKVLEETMKNSDILFVCAAGNSSSNVTYIPSYPACYNLPNVISVGSINSEGEYSKFSNYGSKIDIAAPGENIVSTTPDNKYEAVNGTSVAAPFVAGAGAIIKCLYPNLSSRQISDRIKDSAYKITPLSDKVMTGGILDIGKAVNYSN